MAKAIGELLREFWAGHLSDRAPRAAQIGEAWARLVGPEIAGATQALRLTRVGLTVRIADPLIREEVRLRALSLVEALQVAGFPEIRRLTVRS